MTARKNLSKKGPMMRRLALLGAIFLGLNLTSPTIKAMAQDLPRPLSNLSAFVDATIEAQMRSLDIPSATLSIVHNGALRYAKGYGLANRSTNTPVQASQTLFRPGSTSKLFTWTAVMQLVEVDRIDLDADVNTYLSNFQIPDTYDEPVTMRHLLAHTAGFEDGGLGYLMALSHDLTVPLGEALAQHIPARINPPGKYASYSNYGAALAGHIVANVTGVPFADYVATHILAPLDMDHSTFKEPLPEHLSPLMATGYSRKNGAWAEHPFEFISSFAPAGSLSATATDMANFMLAHLNNGHLGTARILETDTAKQMHSTLFTSDPRIAGMAYGFYETYVNGRRLIGHGGDTTLFHSNLMLDKEAGLGIFVSYMGAKGGRARSDFIKIFYDEYFPEATTSSETTVTHEASLGRYAGTYRFWRKNVSTIEKAMGLFSSISATPTSDNTLLVSGLGEPRQYRQIGETLFRQMEGDQVIAFGLDDASNVQDLYLDGIPFMAASRAPALETPLFSLILPGFCLFMLLTVVTGWLYRGGNHRAYASTTKLALYSTLAVALCHFLFLIGSATVLAVNASTILFEVPKSLQVFLIFANIAGLCAIIPTGLSPLVLRNTQLRLGQKIHFTIVVLSGLYLMWFYYHWNILGMKLP